MNLDKDDLAILCTGMTRDEVDRIHRLLHEWSLGPHNSFPVQLALLTTAQLRAAAVVPRSVNESRKLIELHLAQYRQETANLIQNLSVVQTEGIKELKKGATEHAKRIGEISASASNSLQETKEAARSIKESLDTGVADWQRAKTEMEIERTRLSQLCAELDERIAWRQLLWSILWGFALLLIGISIGIYFSHPHVR